MGYNFTTGLIAHWKTMNCKFRVRSPHIVLYFFLQTHSSVKVWAQTRLRLRFNQYRSFAK